MTISDNRQPRLEQIKAFLSEHNGWSIVIQAMVILPLIVVAYRLQQSAPPISSLPEHAAAIHSIVSVLGVIAIAAVFTLFFVRGLLTRTAILTVAILPIVVVSSGALIRHLGSEIDATFLWGRNNPSLAIAVIAGFMVLWFAVRFGSAFAHQLAIFPRQALAPDRSRSEIEGLDQEWSPEAAAMPYRYYVQYTYTSRTVGGQGFVGIAQSRPMLSVYDVASVAELCRLNIRKEHPGLRDVQVVVQSWQRFETLPPGPGHRDDVPVEAVAENVIAISKRVSQQGQKRRSVSPGQ